MFSWLLLIKVSSLQSSTLRKWPQYYQIIGSERVTGRDQRRERRWFPQNPFLCDNNIKRRNSGNDNNNDPSFIHLFRVLFSLCVLGSPNIVVVGNVDAPSLGQLNPWYSKTNPIILLPPRIIWITDSYQYAQHLSGSFAPIHQPILRNLHRFNQLIIVISSWPHGPHCNCVSYHRIGSGHPSSLHLCSSQNWYGLVCNLNCLICISFLPPPNSIHHHNFLFQHILQSEPQSINLMLSS